MGRLSRHPDPPKIASPPRDKGTHTGFERDGATGNQQRRLRNGNSTIEIATMLVHGLGSTKAQNPATKAGRGVYEQGGLILGKNKKRATKGRGATAVFTERRANNQL